MLDTLNTLHKILLKTKNLSGKTYVLLHTEDGTPVSFGVRLLNMRPPSSYEMTLMCGDDYFVKHSYRPDKKLAYKLIEQAREFVSEQSA